MVEANTSPPVIAIDGPGGAGKGTVAAAVAQDLGWRLLDSGALYRIVALTARQRAVALDDAASLARLALALEVAFSATGVKVDGVDETAAIRAPRAGNDASTVAALPEVRTALLAAQHRFRQPPGLVADGRDMGTVVFPDASLKVFLTATAKARAERRLKQLESAVSLNEAAPRDKVRRRAGPAPAFEQLLAELEARDARDRMREASPMVPAADAYVIDTTTMPIGAVVAAVLARARNHGFGPSASHHPKQKSS